MDAINNYDKIIPLLNFEEGGGDTFYHLQILKRKKEHKDLGSNSYCVKTYYIRSIEYLEKRMPEIIALCDFHNARACINLNRRSFEKMAFHMMRKICDQIMNHDFRSVYKAYESVCGTYSSETEKKWIIDFDEKDLTKLEVIRTDIKNCEPNPGVDKTYAVLETKNGWHLITSPFRIDEFRKIYSAEPEIHKDNPAIIYCPIPG
jgi:hypothetical protein